LGFVGAKEDGWVDALGAAIGFDGLLAATGLRHLAMGTTLEADRLSCAR
jgi:hypothetical protein